MTGASIDVFEARAAGTASGCWDFDNRLGRVE
jgi:hypothetical protein